METTNLREYVLKWNYVFWQVSKVFGAPVLFCMMLLFLQKIVFTGTCAFAGYKCDQSLSYATSAAAKVNEAVSGGATIASDAETLNLQGFPPESRDKIFAAADKEAKRLNAGGR